MKEGKILRAGLDVLEYEKLSLKLFPRRYASCFQYLLEAPNVILTPRSRLDI
jgi:D-3-phosphoglycerate dehydrogenase